jgi:hypothetical protein
VASVQLTRDADVQFYTGLSNTNVFKTLFDNSGVLNVSQRLGGDCCVFISLLFNKVLGQNTERYVLRPHNDRNIHVFWYRHFQYNFVDLVGFCLTKFVAVYDLSVNNETGS